MKQISEFNLYSFGIVAKDIVVGEYIIEVFPIENQTHVDGDIDETVINKIESKDIHGNVRSIVLNRRASLVATWMPDQDSNRLTAPTVRRGEEVKIYRYADTDEFFWTTAFHEYDLRKQEVVKHYYSNTGVFKEDLNDDNTYWEEVNTIDKKWRIHTSDNDGEVCTWDIELDSKAGILSVKDGRGNYLEHNAAEDTFTGKFKKEMNFIAPTINMTATTINMKADTLNENIGTINTNADNHLAAINNMGIKGSSLTHNDKNVGSTHSHPESIGSRTGGPS